MTREIEVLNKEIDNPNLWENKDRAREIIKKREILQDKLSVTQSIELEFNTIKELMEIAESENEEEIIEELEYRLEILNKDLDELRVKLILNEEADENSTFLEINAGAGGTEAQDWADMLLRMYIRWAEKHNYKIEFLHEHKGDEAGIKSATIKIVGYQAYGWLKTESGVHRLVRISPFDSNARRHTSFASVWVYPEISQKMDIAIDEKDLRIDVYRASGAGGQHVNKTESAVRITHIPTNIVVQSQNNRSQHRNKAECISMLKSRLYELELRKKREKLQKEHESKKEIGWGSQIRSYVLHPYQMVKDLRTNIESSNPDDVLDGNLDEFIQAALINKV